MALSFGKILSNPDNQDRLAAVGAALSALGQGQSADLSQYRQRIAGRAEDARMREALSDPALLDRFTPEQRQMLSTLPPAVAQQLIAETVFAPPPAPTEGKVVGDRLVNPITGEVMADFTTPQPGWIDLSPEEVQALGLPEGAYQRGPDNKLARVGGGGQTINIGGEETPVLQISSDGNRALISDPNATGGIRWIEIEGGEAATDTAKGNAQADLAIQTIDGLIADPGLDAITGASGLLVGEGDGFIARMSRTANPEAARALSRAKQIQGQVFLDAFEALKGGGQITEIEGQKAEQARARLDRAQSRDDYVAALQELREIFALASSRPPGSVQWNDAGTPASSGAPETQTPRRLVYNPETGGFD